MSKVLLDAAGRRRSPATMPGFHAGRPPRNKGCATRPIRRRSSEIVSVMRPAGDDLHGQRLRGLIVVLWRAGCGSAKRSRSTRPTSTRAAARSSCAAAKAGAAARSAWTTGPGNNSSRG